MGKRLVGIAILGAGRWGQHLLRNFVQHPLSQVVAIADPRHSTLDQAAHCISDASGGALGGASEGSDVLLAADWRVAIAAAGVEAVAIATPASTHTPLIEAALSRGLHVLVEKPLTLDIDEARHLCNLAASQQRVLMVDHTYLFHPAIQAGKAMLQSSGIGQPRYGYAARTHLGPVRSDVDVLWDLAIHDIAIFNHWLGDRPCKAQAMGTTWLQSQINPSPLFPQGLPDVVWATLTYPNGVQAMLHLSWLNPDKQRRLCLVGEIGTLVFDEMQTQPLTLLQGQMQQQETGFFPQGSDPVAIAFEPQEPLQQVCTHFLNHIQTQTCPSLSDGQTGLDLIRVLVALSASLNQAGRAVAISYD